MLQKQTKDSLAESRDAPAAAGSRTGENSFAARIFVVLAFAAMAMVAGHALRANRMRYDRMAFGVYYMWWKTFANGLDPWRAQPPCNYTPAFVVWFSPLTRLPQQTAYWIWQCSQVVAFFAAVFTMIGECGRLTKVQLAALLAFVAALMPYFLTSTIYEAEPSALLLLLLCGAWRLARHNREVAAGLMLALATVLKVYPVIAGGYFLFRRRFATVVWGAGFTLLGVTLSRPSLWIDSLFHGAAPYFASLGWVQHGRAISILLNVYEAWPALQSRGGPANTGVLAVTATLTVCLIAICALITRRARTDPIVDGITLGLWLAAMLLLSPLSWNHEVTLTLPIYLFSAIGVVTAAPISIGGIALASLAIAGCAAAYYSTPIRNHHIDFVALLAGFSAACALVRSPDSLRQTAPPPWSNGRRARSNRYDVARQR